MAWRGASLLAWVSINAAIVFSKRPRFDYIPLDEKHPFYPEDAYSLCKQ
jgi:UDP-glucose 4-epimerase